MRRQRRAPSPVRAVHGAAARILDNLRMRRQAV